MPENSGAMATFTLGRKTDSLSVKSGLAQFDLNDDPGFEKIVVSVMPDPIG
jgi:hypothetical protein